MANHVLRWNRGYGAGMTGAHLEVRCQGRSWIATLPPGLPPISALQDFQTWHKSQYGIPCEGAIGRIYRDGKLRTSIRPLQ